MLRVHAAVRKDNKGGAAGDGLAGLAAQLVQRPRQPLAIGTGREQHGQGHGPETGAIEMADFRQLFVAQDRGLELEQAATFRAGLEQIALGTERSFDLRHQLLANGVERRVGHLREQLLEIVVQQSRTVGQHRQRGVVAHGADRLLALLRHRRHEDAQVLVRITEGLLALQHGGVIRLRQLRRLRQLIERHQVLLQPFAVRLRRGVALFQLGVVNDAAFARIHQEDASRMQAFLDEHVLRRDVEHADLGGHDHQTVFRDVVARRTQAVAVENGADDAAVGEGDRGRAVPRLHQAAVIFVEGLAVLVHHLVTAPRLRNHHQHRVRQLASGHVQELEHVVEGGRVRAVLHHDRQDFFQVIAEQRRGAQRLARAHPVDVAAQGVDLAVVGDVTERVRQRPRREGVGGEARVHQRQRRFHRRIGQVGEHRFHLDRREHALVHQGARRQAGDIEQRAFFQVRIPDRLLDALADDIELALEGHVIGDTGGTADENLPEQRFG